MKFQNMIGLMFVWTFVILPSTIYCYFTCPDKMPTPFGVPLSLAILVVLTFFFEQIDSLVEKLRAENLYDRGHNLRTCFLKVNKTVWINRNWYYLIALTCSPILLTSHIWPFPTIILPSTLIALMMTNYQKAQKPIFKVKVEGRKDVAVQRVRFTYLDEMGSSQKEEYALIASDGEKITVIGPTFKTEKELSNAIFHA